MSKCFGIRKGLQTHAAKQARKKLLHYQQTHVQHQHARQQNARKNNNKNAKQI